jgi:bifunctional isochorismate lyase/aryl carrier protein
MSFDDLRRQVLALVDVPEEELDSAANLLDYGLDSIQVLELVERRQSEGLAVDLAMLSREPSLDGWWRAIAPLVEGSV